MLEVRDIYKAYGKRQVLSGANLQAESGLCTGIVGSNGCGKTTLLSILAGAQKPDRGSVYFNGVEACGRRNVFYAMAAYVPQENPFFPELSARDNLLLWYKGDSRRMKEDLTSGPGAFLGVGSFLNQRADRLSGGMKKRLSIACALASHAPYLIMDEPGASLDLECKQLIREYLKSYVNQGGTVILTSHEMEELSLCRRLYVLRDKKLHQVQSDLTAEELIRLF